LLNAGCGFEEQYTLKFSFFIIAIIRRLMDRLEGYGGAYVKTNFGIVLIILGLLLVHCFAVGGHAEASAMGPGFGWKQTWARGGVLIAVGGAWWGGKKWKN